LYHVLDVAIECGFTSINEFHIFVGVGAFLAFPLYIYGLASGMVIATQYVEDSWTGHPLSKRFVFGRLSGIVTEWALGFIFIGLPVICLCATLFLGLENWWEITSLVWFGCICLFYVAFAAAVVGVENTACFEVMRNKYNIGNEPWYSIMRRSILLRQRNAYGGVVTRTYLVKGTLDHSFKADGVLGCEIEKSRRSHLSVYARLISMKFLSTEGGLGLFQKLDEPSRLFTLEDVKKERPFVTAHNWSLLGMFCKPANARFINILKGPQALTTEQMQSSLICALIGNIMIILIIAGLLVWLGLPSLGILIVILLVVAFGMYPGIVSILRIFWMTKDVVLALGMMEKEQKNDREKAEDGSKIETQGIFQAWETYRIITLRETMCWIIFTLEIFFLILWPLISFIYLKNYATGMIFFLIAVFSFLRTYFNAATVLEEDGSLDLVDGDKGSHRHWQSMSRLSIIVTKISRSRGTKIWGSILLLFLILFLGLFALAITDDGNSDSQFQFTYLKDFEYKQPNSFNYPACSSGGSFNSSTKTDLSDFAYLAILAYRDPRITQIELDQWFGEGVAIDNQTFVDEYRKRVDGFKSAVSFKLITFPSLDNLSVMSIRGTTNAWDALTDIQLWSPAALFQALRTFLPLGNIWNPILHHMIHIISWLASESINRISFYRDTTKFVVWMQESKRFSNIKITGHSLGGGKCSHILNNFELFNLTLRPWLGLSLISGAQAGVNAFALSGPNTLLSRSSFDPPITVDALNKFTFNVIPDRDIVPQLDDVAQLNQRISCTANVNDYASCHDGRRSLCQIIHTCGSQNRPALCECVTEFGYPEPLPKDGVSRTFAEACARK
jgi:hypothetical protein